MRSGEVKSLNPDEVYKGMLESFKENLEAEECSFYETEGDHLKFKLSNGWKEYYRRLEAPTPSAKESSAWRPS